MTVEDPPPTNDRPVEIPPEVCTLLVDAGSPPADELAVEGALDASRQGVPPGVPTA